MLTLIRRTRFLVRGVLTRKEIDELFGYTRYGQGGLYVLCREERSSRISNELHILLDEDKPLPDRFERFHRLRGVGIWTASQILSKWKPKSYAFVAVGSHRGPFMEETLFNRLSNRQLQSFEQDAVINNRIDPANYEKATIRYLQLSQVLAEVKEVLGLEYYWEVQNLLWSAWKRRQVLPKRHSPAKGGLGEKRLGRILSTEAIAESDAKGMEIVKKYEVREKRTPDTTPSTRAVGYDMVSKDGEGNAIYIEVKTRFGSFSRTLVALTETQRDAAESLRDQYYLYVVTGDNEIRIVADPARRCSMKPIRRIDYQLLDWQKKAKTVRVM